jgi:protocatechuate 3,4-dioxygenase beta subunit
MKWLSITLVSVLLAGCTGLSGVPSAPGAAAPTEPAATEPVTPTAAPLAEGGAGGAAAATAVPCRGELTPRDQEGPYYTPGSPERASLLEEGMAGVPIVVFGRVFDQNCEPLAGAVVDFWQADAAGVYDNVGYTLRGRVTADEGGAYAMETIEPGVYPGRPPHLHVKVFAPDGRELLTTQLYITGRQGTAGNGQASVLLVPYLGTDDAGRQQVPFDFVVDARGG